MCSCCLGALQANKHSKAKATAIDQVSGERFAMERTEHR